MPRLTDGEVSRPFRRRGLGVGGVRVAVGGVAAEGVGSLFVAEAGSGKVVTAVEGIGGVGISETGVGASVGGGGGGRGGKMEATAFSVSESRHRLFFGTSPNSSSSALNTPSKSMSTS